jgi:hypothetical protein
MDEDIQNAIAAVERTLEALDAKKVRIRALLEQLKAEAGVSSPSAVVPPRPESTVITAVTPEPPSQEPAIEALSAEKIAEIIESQERINEDDYPIESLKGLSRLGVAMEIAKKNDGYVTPAALRKILVRSGVLRGTKQIASIASRVLAESSSFEKKWPGLYKLKEYES